MHSPAFVLHRYSYRESSLLLKIFSREGGIFSLIVKAAKKTKTDAYGLLQNFQPLMMDFQLQGDFARLKHVERSQEPPHLKEEALYSAFYLNELLLFLLHPQDPAPAIFDLYAQTLRQLEQASVEIPLRLFELQLLKFLGFLPDLLEDEQGHDIVSDQSYFVYPGQLPKQIADVQKVASLHVFLGQDLRDIVKRQWTFDSLRAAKRLCRIFIDDHTRGKTFKSREIFAAARSLALKM